jgi:hypothetical protein
MWHQSPANTPAELEVTGDDFTPAVNMTARTDVSTDQLFAVLRGEPARGHIPTVTMPPGGAI